MNHVLRTGMHSVALSAVHYAQKRANARQYQRLHALQNESIPLTMPLLIVASGLHLSTASVTCQQAPSSVAQSSSQSQLKTSVNNRSVQPQLELLRVTTVAFTVSCLTKQPMQYWLWAASFVVSL